MGIEYMQQSAADFLNNLDHIQAELAGFSEEIDAKSNEVAKLLTFLNSKARRSKGISRNI